MAGASFEEKLKEIPFIKEERIVPIVEKILSEKPEKPESIQVQLNTKGYENRKDPSMTKDIVFPHPMKIAPSVCVIGNESVRPHAEKLGLPFFSVADCAGADKKKEREEIVDKFRGFILCKDYQKAFSLRDILRRRKRTHYMCPDENQLPTVYENVRKSYRLKVRDWHSVSFPVGNTEMGLDEIVQNIRHAVSTIASGLKKGPQNLKECYIKRTSSTSMMS